MYATWVYLLQSKYDVKTILPTFFYVSNSIWSFNKIFSIIMHMTYLLSKFSNLKGLLFFILVLKHLNKTLWLNESISIFLMWHLFYMFNLTLCFVIGDCVLLVEYLINRTLFFLLSNKCPFELLYHKKTFIWSSLVFWMSLLWFHIVKSA